MAEPWFQICRTVALPPIAFWFDWRFEGLERIPETGPAIVACNHISYMDPLSSAYSIVKAGRRPRFLAKEDLFHIPLVGRALKGAGQIPVRREAGDAAASLRQMMKALTEDQVVVIYPEGTVTKRPDHRPMEGKTGTVRLSLASGVPITPMASWGSQAIWQKSGRGSLKYGRPIWVKAGSPLDLSDRADQANDHDALKEMTAEVMTALTTLVEDLAARYPEAWSSGA